MSMSSASFAFGSVEYAKSASTGSTGTEMSRATDQGAATSLTAANIYDCGGIMRNLDRVLGTPRYLWLLPVDAPGLSCVLSTAAHKKLAQCAEIR